MKRVVAITKETRPLTRTVLTRDARPFARAVSTMRPVNNLSLIIVVLSFVVLGCRMPAFLEQANSNSTAVSNGNGPQAAAVENPATAPTGDARADVIRTSKKFLDQPEFSATMDGEGKTPMHIELDYEQPDRFRMVNQLNGVQSETIIIGRDMYMRVGERWQKMPNAMGKTVPQMRQFFDEQGLESLKDVSYVGEDSIDGRDAHVYSYRNQASKDGSPYPFTSKIWVRQTDGLPAKIEVDYEGGDLRKMTIVYDYDKAVSIEPPVAN